MSWREEVAGAVGEWLRLEGPGKRVEWKPLGRATRTGEGGRFTVDARGSELKPDQIEGLRIAGPTIQSIEQGFAVLDLSTTGSTHTVRVTEVADPEDPHLWVFQQPTTFLIEAIRSRLDELGEAPLSDLLADGQLAGPPSSSATPSDLLPAQAEAYRACLGTGVRLVWGPPGTGKTMVLKKAIGDLMAAGQRVLLLSSTNIAVDNALLGVIKEGRHQDGDIVRAGTAQLREVAQDSTVALDLIVRERLKEVSARRHQLELQLSDLEHRQRQLTFLEQQIVRFDPVRFADARALLAAAVGGDDATRRSCVQLTQELEQLDASITRVGTELREAVAAQAAAESDRRAWRRARDLKDQVRDLFSAAGARESAAVLHQSAAERARTEVARLSSLPRIKRWLAKDELATARQKFDVAEKEQSRLSGLAAAARTAASAADDRSRAEIRKIANAANHSPEELLQVDVHAATAKKNFDAAKARRSSLAERLREARTEADGAKEARRIVDDAERAGYPRLHSEVEQLRTELAGDDDQRKALQTAYREVKAEHDQLARDAAGETIDRARLLATTLARFRTNTRVFGGQYDVVLVDEAGAATLPELLLAVGRAKKAAVLFGDFMQLSAVLPPSVKKSTRQEVKDWLHPDVFTHCEITDAKSAQDHVGCITLSEQSRFGPAIMCAANLIAYDDSLTPGPAIKDRKQDAVEIVLIDTDGLGALAKPYLTSRRAGWWPAGVLLSRALVELHQAEGRDVGVVTPYAPQARATLEALRDVERVGSPLAEVGTAHRFQGREFPVVVFDTVESSYPPLLWMGSAARTQKVGSWPHDGVRLFNVAITRTQQRLYVIASAAKMRDAAPDNPFAALQRLRDNPGVRRIPATALIAPTGPPETDQVLDELGAKLKAVLARHVEVTNVDDETTFFDTFRREIKKACHSIWIWAPWVTRFGFERLIEPLADAKGRGVEITVFVRDPSDILQRRTIELIDRLRVEVGQAVPINVMHQKIAVFDEKTVMLGSLNMLSQRRTREVMVTMQGAYFAQKILEHEHARTFAKVPSCPSCHLQTVEIRRSKDETWRWRCYNSTCPGGTGRNAWTQDIILTTKPPR